MSTRTLQSQAALLAELQATLAELEEAEELIRKTSGKSAFIGFSGGIMIETSKDEALEYIERRKRAIKALIEKIQAEIRKTPKQS